MIREYFIKYYLQTRNFIKSSWCPIIWLEKNNIKYNNFILLYLINFFPQYFLFSFLGYFDFNFLYSKDNIFYHYPSYNSSVLNIAKPILNINLKYSGQNSEVTNKFSEFDNSTPIHVILNYYNYIIEDNSIFEIEYFDDEIKSKTFHLERIKNLNINTLLN